MPLGETGSPACPRREESANLTYDVNVDNVDSHQMAYADLPLVPHIRTRSLGYGNVVAGWSDRYYLPRVFGLLDKMTIIPLDRLNTLLGTR